MKDRAEHEPSRSAPIDVTVADQPVSVMMTESPATVDASILLASNEALTNRALALEKAKADVVRQLDEERRTAGQRRTSMLWETTQAVIAIAVTVSFLYATTQMILSEGPSSSKEGAFLLLSNAFILVVSTYIMRTNSHKVGGRGPDVIPQKESGR